MKLLRLIIISLFTIVVTLFFLVSLYVRFFTKEIVEETVSKLSGQKVFLQSINYSFPFGLTASHFQWTDNITADRVELQLYPESLWEKTWHLKNVYVTGIKINFKKQNVSGRVSVGGADKSLVQGQTNQSSPIGAALPDNQKMAKGIKIDRLQFSQGQVRYADDSIRNGFYLLVGDIWLNVEQCAFPLKSVPIYYQTKAKVLNSSLPLRNFSVLGNGWVDLVGKNMSGEFHVVGSQKQNQMFAILVSEKNNMKVQGKIVEADVMAHLPRLNSFNIEEGSLSQLLSGIGLGVDVHFAFETKFDDFKIDKIKFWGDIIKDSPSEEIVAPK